MTSYRNAFHESRHPGAGGDSQLGQPVGDGLLAENFRVPLTTGRVPKTEMGEAALRLARDLQADKPVEPRALPVEIIVRASTQALAEEKSNGKA